MEDEIAAIRARHEAAKQAIDDDRYYSSPGGRPPPFFPSRGGEQAHTDRAALLRTVDRLSAELAKERERRVEWQPIETAPRDGQDILVYCQDTSEMFVGFSNPDEIAADPGIFFYALRTDGRRIGCRPHLWRPLPTPPATTQHEDTP